METVNVFDTLKSYGEKWQVVNKRQFNDNEKAVIRSNKVMPSDYGLSVCFTMVNGKTHYIPLSNQSQLTVGQSVNIDTVNLLTLERDGKHILRVQE